MSRLDVNRHSEHAETYLRLLAEAALRASPRAADSAERTARARRAAGVLVDAGVLDDTRADEILLMLAAALSVRGQGVRGQRGWVAAGRVRGMGTRPSTATQSSTATAGHDTLRVIRPTAGQVPGSKLMALIVTADRIIAPATLRFPPSAGLSDLAAPSFADLTVSDDTGASYQVNSTEGGWAGSTWTGTILFRPTPSPGARLLTVIGPNGPVLRAQLTPDPAAGQPVATVVPLPDSPGERLLIRRAEALLGDLARPGLPRARPAAGPQVMRPLGLSFLGTAPPSPVTPTVGPSPAAVFSGSRGDREPDLAEVIEILEEARILSPLSPVPATVAVLSQVLGLGGQSPRALGLADTASGPNSGEKLPGRWHAVLAYYGRRTQQQFSSGTGSIGVTLPEVDGARFAVAGVHTGRNGSILHVVGRGLRPVPRPRQDMRFSWWARDESGTWHLAIVQAWNLANDDLLHLRLALLPPLRPADPGSTGTLTLEVSGTTSQLTADVTVHW